MVLDDLNVSISTDCFFECYHGLFIIINHVSRLLIIVDPTNGFVVYYDYFSSIIGLHTVIFDLVNSYLNDHMGYIKVNTNEGAK